MTTERGHRPPSSEERIRQAKRRLQGGNGAPSTAHRMETRTEGAGRVQTPEPADGVARSESDPGIRAAKTSEKGHALLSRIDTPSASKASRRWVKTLAISAGVVLLLLALLFAVVLLDGVRTADPDVTGNVSGFLILLGLTLIPGGFLAGWGLRRRSADRADTLAISRRIRWPRLIVVALAVAPIAIAVYTLAVDVLGLPDRTAGIAVTVLVAGMVKFALGWVLD